MNERIRRFDGQLTGSPATEIVAREIYIFKYFSSFRLLSSSQVGRGFQPNITGMPHAVVREECFDARVEQIVTSALQHAVRSLASNYSVQ